MKAFPEIERVFADFYNNPFQVLNENDQKLRTFEIFVILMYSRNANETCEFIERGNVLPSNTKH